MEPITHYTSSDGTSTPIVELNNFHLVNALLKVITADTDGTDKGIADGLELIRALKAEVLKRMDNRPVQA